VGKGIIFGYGLGDEGKAVTRISRAVPPRGDMAALVTVGAALRWEALCVCAVGVFVGMVWGRMAE
jgi:hypothetical protein